MFLQISHHMVLVWYDQVWWGGQRPKRLRLPTAAWDACSCSLALQDLGAGRWICVASCSGTSTLSNGPLPEPLALPLQGKVDMARIPRLLSSLPFVGFLTITTHHLFIICFFLHSSLPFVFVFSPPSCGFPGWGPAAFNADFSFTRSLSAPCFEQNNLPPMMHHQGCRLSTRNLQSMLCTLHFYCWCRFWYLII